MCPVSTRIEPKVVEGSFLGNNRTTFEEKISLKESRSENILLLRDEFHSFVSSSYLSLYPDLFDNNGIQSYILDYNSPLLSIKEVQVNYQIHEEDQEDSYPCHQSMSS